MRYRDLLEARPWRRYSGEERKCFIGQIDADEAADTPLEAKVEFGTVATGRQAVWAGFFVRVEVDGQQWLAEDPYSLRRALRGVEAKLNSDGISLHVIGLDPEWHESGLSGNTGWGYHPELDGAVHMLTPPPNADAQPNRIRS